MLCDDRRTLLWLANQRVGRVPRARSSAPGRRSPTGLVLDLDPPEGADFGVVVQAARLVRQALDGLGAERGREDQRVEGRARRRPGAGRAVRGRRRPRPGRSPPAPSASTPSSPPPPTSRRTGTAGSSSTRRARARPRSSPPTARGSGRRCRCPRRSAGTPWTTCRPRDFTVTSAADRFPTEWAAELPEPQTLPADLVAEGHTIPIARVQAMHEGKRRKRAQQAAGRGRGTRRLTAVPRPRSSSTDSPASARSVGTPAQAPRMTHDPQTIAWLDQEDAHLAQVIRAHRWSVQYVGAGDEPDEPPFGYTVGLFGLGHPELVVVGLGPQTTHSVAQPGRGHRRRRPGPRRRASCSPWPDWADIRLVVEELPNPGEVVLAANRFYERPAEYSVPALQLTWAVPRPLLPVGAGLSVRAGRAAAARHVARLTGVSDLPLGHHDRPSWPDGDAAGPSAAAAGRRCAAGRTPAPGTRLAAPPPRPDRAHRRGARRSPRSNCSSTWSSSSRSPRSPRSWPTTSACAASSAGWCCSRCCGSRGAATPGWATRPRRRGRGPGRGHRRDGRDVPRRPGDPRGLGRRGRRHQRAGPARRARWPWSASCTWPSTASRPLGDAGLRRTAAEGRRRPSARRPSCWCSVPCSAARPRRRSGRSRSSSTTPASTPPGSDWRLPAPGHFAERYGLIVIIALGESIIAVGVGVTDLPLTVPIAGAALLGLAVSVALWWAYFDVVAPVAERVLRRRTGERAGPAGPRLLHLPALPDGRRRHLPGARAEEGGRVRRRHRPTTR